MIAPAADVLHRPVAALVRAYGVPASVASRDDGQRFDFTDGANGSFSAKVDGATVTKPITREVFASPPSVCG